MTYIVIKHSGTYNNNNNNSIFYYLYVESTATRPITDTAQCRKTNTIIMPNMGEET
jgi:hypothetical protein